jgi:uncharacterized protein
MFWLDPTYIMFALPGLVLALVATAVTKSTFSKYSRIASRSGLTGAQAARRLLDAEGLRDVGIETVQSFLGDHYDPRTRTLRLSPDVYRSNSLSAIGVACHEAGHALQHAHEYAPLAMRTALVPVTQLSSNAALPMILLGMIFRFPMLINLGIIFFSVAVLFAIVTLPVEWNASARAKRLMVADGIVAADEQQRAGAVLNAAFMTYIASAVTAVLMLLYYLSLGSRR